jgi:hypothetical protein
VPATSDAIRKLYVTDAGLQRFRNAPDPRMIMSVQVCREPVFGDIGEFNGLSCYFEAEERRNPAKTRYQHACGAHSFPLSELGLSLARSARVSHFMRKNTRAAQGRYHTQYYTQLDTEYAALILGIDWLDSLNPFWNSTASRYSLLKYDAESQPNIDLGRGRGG